ncbi:MAG: response regulator [Elusimicrobia bacterium]|nr:response regulator [Elusimicrobiota bacterium]
MKILIAEDDAALRLLLEEFLTGLGHEVSAAENGTGLVKTALEGRPDLIVTDLHMPEMSGDSMIAMLDMYPDLAGIPVIILTGATHMELADMGIPREIPILNKPFDFDKISGLVARYVK